MRLEFIRSRAGSDALRGTRYDINSSTPLYHNILIYHHRAFQEILKADRGKYGGEDNYDIGDAVADEWQQRVDDVVAGTADVA
jgi:hypothetical protein